MLEPEIRHGVIWPQSGFVPRRSLTLRGWCFAGDGGEVLGVRAITSAGRIFKGKRKQPTFALGLDFPGCPGANYAGYSIELELPRGRSSVRVECRVTAGGEWKAIEHLELFAPWLWEGPERCGFDYKLWLSRYDARSSWDIEAWRDIGEALPTRPSFTILVHAGDSFPALKRTLMSLRAQVYPEWNCQVVGGEDFPPLPPLGAGHLLAAGEAPTGDYLAVMDAGDRLAPHTLSWIARAAHESAAGGEGEGESRGGGWEGLAAGGEGGGLPLLIYTDEDVVDAQGQRGEPWFKPEWDPEDFLSRDYISRSGFFLRAAFPDGVGSHRELAAALEDEPATRIHRIPVPLYHRAEREDLEGSGVRVFHPLVHPLPKVDIIIPTRDQADLLRTAVGSIRRRTDYDGYRLVIVDNDSREPEALAYLDELREEGESEGVRVLRHPGRFNFAAIVNEAARQSDAELLAFVNNDVEVISPGWLRSMAELATQEKIGAVGVRLLYPDRRIQHAGVFLGFRDSAGHLYKGMPADGPDLMRRRDVVHQVSAVTAACMMVERSKFFAVKGFDSAAFPVSANDVDFCLKLSGAGYRNVICPDAELVHRESASRGESEQRPDRKEAAKQEMLSLFYRWPELVAEDPFYNPNLTVQYEDVSLAEPPRVQPSLNGESGYDVEEEGH